MKTDTEYKPRRRRTILVRLIGWILAVCAIGYALAVVWPSIGAKGADVLRGMIGDPAVAWLEGAVFQVQDALMQMEYRLGAKPDAPWAVGSIASTPQIESPVPNTPRVFSTPTVNVGNPSTPSPTATPVRWPPLPVPALGMLQGEGEWTPYFSNAQGETVAYRTFLQPDPDRPYAIAAIVAADLDKIRLRYVLGFEEPFFKDEVDVERTGIIPKADRQPGVLLAAFNGGFLTRHGIFGVVVDGKILVPMIDGLGTLAIYPDGRVRIGVWGSDITSLEGISTIRQNGPIVIRDGKINPRAFEDSLELWGASLSGDMTTWRSAVGVSADGRTLYYMAGWSLNMPALAHALKTAGAYSAIQLDINHFWVLFTRFVFEPDGPKAFPLLDEMKENVDRYLYACSRDYFYLASKTP
ncbi:MAG: phosphodiester glycosidase family protein [Anaerolineales bacterium]